MFKNGSLLVIVHYNIHLSNGICCWIICVLMRLSPTRPTLSFAQCDFLSFLKQQIKTCPTVNKRNLVLWILSNVIVCSFNASNIAVWILLIRLSVISFKKAVFLLFDCSSNKISSILQKEDFFVIWMFVQYDCVFYLSIEALLYCLSIWPIGLLVLSFNAKNLVAIVQYHLSFYHSTGVILLFLLLSSNSDGPFLFELCSLVLVWGGLPTLKKSQARFFIVFSFLSHTTLI